jgi:hypothetical protein
MIQKIWDWFDSFPKHRIGIRLLQGAIGFALLFRASTEGPYAEFLFGNSGIGHSFRPNSGLHFIDAAFSTGWGSISVVALMGLAGLGLMFGYVTRLATFVALITLNVLMLRCPTVGDGGDNICQLVLIYLLFAMPNGRKERMHSLETWTHNVAVAAIALQIIVLYTTSGMMKATGVRWSSGVAMYYISQVEWFSLPAVRSIFRNPLIVAASTYLPMMFQIWFPVAIFSRLKVPFLIVGILFHIGVAAFMGLVTFSTVMIGLELFLISDAEFEKIGELLSSIPALLKRGLPVRKTLAIKAD